MQAWAIGTGFVDDVGELDVPELALRRHDVHARVHLPVPQRALLLRAQHVHGRDGARAGRLRRLSDRAAADAARSSGFTDSVADFTGVSSDVVASTRSSTRTPRCPSMHVGFALMLGVPMIRMARHRWAKALWALYPPIVTFVVVVTGQPLGLRRRHRRAGRRRLRASPRRRCSRACARGRGPGHRPRGPARPGARRIGSRPRHPVERSARDRRRDYQARVPQPADRVAADAERDLADRLRPVRRRRGAWSCRAGGSPAASPSSSARSATRSTAATRACRARARRSARSWTRRSTASRRASCSPRSPYQFSQGPGPDDHRRQRRRGRVVVVAVLASLMVSYTRARAEALGVECKVGIADRAVRVVILSAGLVFGDLKDDRAGRLRARRAGGRHGLPAHLPRALGARRSL